VKCGFGLPRVPLQPWKLVGKSDYFYLLQIAIGSVLLFHFLPPLPLPLSLLVLGKDLPASDVAILGAQDLVFDELGSAVVFGRVEMRQFFDKLVDIVFAGCVDAPLSNGTRGQAVGPENLDLHRAMVTMEFSKMSFFLCCTLTCRSRKSPSSRYNHNYGKRSPAPNRFAGGALPDKSRLIYSGGGRSLAA